MARLAIFLEKTREKYEDKLNTNDRSNRRGQFTAVNVGITRGSGAKVSRSCNRDFFPVSE